jgi:hypothetical protein
VCQVGLDGGLGQVQPRGRSLCWRGLSRRNSMGLGANPPAHGLQYLDGVLLLSAGMTEVRGHDHGPCRGTRPDQLWQLVVPLLPTPPRPPYGGRRRTVSDRNCLAAMIFMARTSTPWRCCRQGNWAVARRRRSGAAWLSGRERAYSTLCIWRCCNRLPSAPADPSNLRLRCRPTR